MNDANFYQVLGVGRSASADEIRSAYRELVKRHHPDLFRAAGEKAEATEKLRQINEAYAVLGNAERRQRYDQKFVQKPQPRPRAAAAAERRRTSPPRRQAELRRKTIKIPKLRLRFAKKWAGYSLAAATVILVLIYAGRSEPRLTTAWVLLEKLEVSLSNMAPRDSAGTGWVRVGEYVSVSECAAAIKHKVRKDEQEGSQAVYDERNGTMAITLYVKKETAQGPQATAEAAESLPQDSITKRVRSIECRASQRVEMESRFQRALRRMGLHF
ncbi:MAG: J domain-containing protein [Candidatus Binatia bacterium]